MTFNERKTYIEAKHKVLLTRKNTPIEGNGIVCRYKNPILTADHAPLNWRYDFNPATNPYFMERLGINATFNSGAIFLNGKYLLVVRVEGDDRKSFFAVAESDNGIDNFRFWDHPITMPEAKVSPLKESPAAEATNVYDMRLTQHEDGWIYGLFCVERHDDSHEGNLSAATATCGIARTRDLANWERLDDLKSNSQQRNVVLHPEFVSKTEIVNGELVERKCYALYTRPQDGFIDAGSGGGIGWALVDDIEHAVVKEEKIINARHYHTIMEVKNGEGPHPLKTPKGWLHLAHGVRGCASGLRYVLYMYMTSLDDPTQVIAQPGGAFMVPKDDEYIGDVMNVLFSNGWVATPKEKGDMNNENAVMPGNAMHEMDDQVFIYYASSDTRMHVATSTIGRLVDYCISTPADMFTTGESVKTRNRLIDWNLSFPEER